MKSLIVLNLFLLFSCAGYSKKEWDFSNLGEPSNRDYVDHLVAIGDAYLNYDENKQVALSKDSKLFLTQLYDRIVTNNEYLLTDTSRPEFFIIKQKTPFIFSLPRSKFYFSTGILSKYLKSEEIFLAAFTAEIIRSQRKIYEKKMLIPLGFCTTEKMISLTKIKPEVKTKVNEWSYFALKRAGFDPSAYLNWIQVQNRNTLDFSLYLGDSIGISREEFGFKNFMSRQGVASVEKKINEANSSKEFYKLLANVASN